jgi:hypothetical protein
MLSYKQYILQMIEEGKNEDLYNAMTPEQVNGYIDTHHKTKGKHEINGVLGHAASRISSVPHLEKLLGHHEGWVVSNALMNPNATKEHFEAAAKHGQQRVRDLAKVRLGTATREEALRVASANPAVPGSKDLARKHLNMSSSEVEAAKGEVGRGASKGSSVQAKPKTKSQNLPSRFAGASPEELKKHLKAHEVMGGLMSDDEESQVRKHLADHESSAEREKLPSLPGKVSGLNPDQLRKSLKYHDEHDNTFLEPEEEKAVRAHVAFHDKHPEAVASTVEQKKVPSKSKSEKAPVSNVTSEEDPELAKQFKAKRATKIIKDGQAVALVHTNKKGQHLINHATGEEIPHEAKTHEEAVEHAKNYFNTAD